MNQAIANVRFHVAIKNRIASDRQVTNLPCYRAPPHDYLCFLLLVDVIVDKPCTIQHLAQWEERVILWSKNGTLKLNEQTCVAWRSGLIGWIIS